MYLLKEKCIMVYDLNKLFNFIKLIITIKSAYNILDIV